MGDCLSGMSGCLGREEARPSLLEHYHKVHKEMCDLESLLENRIKNARCC